VAERVIIGVDESGTGAWAGPYSVTALAAYEHDSDLLRRAGGRDSKRMTDIRRRAAIVTIADVALFASTKLVQVAEIDARKKDAWRRAIFATVREVVEEVCSRGIAEASIEVVIDGLPDPTVRTKITKELWTAVRFLTSAEDQVPAVGAASVIAKTERNDAMKALHEKYPRYGWNKNYGYGTEQHLQAIKQYGRSPEHRDLKVDVLKG
jgi:ribonuclease HII